MTREKKVRRYGVATPVQAPHVPLSMVEKSHADSTPRAKSSLSLLIAATPTGMSATAKHLRAGVPDEFIGWWLTFNNGVIDEEEEKEEHSDSDSDYEAEVEEGTATTAAATASENASDNDQQMMAAACVEKESCAAHHGDEEISEDTHELELLCGLQRKKRQAAVAHSKLHMTEIEIHNKNAQEYLRAENEMLRLQLALKTKEVETEENQRLKLELDLKTKKIKSLRKQIRKLRAQNDKYNKTVSCIRKFVRKLYTTKKKKKKKKKMMMMMMMMILTNTR